MPRESFDTLQKRRADAAREKRREEAESPRGDTAKALVESAEKYRKHRAITREPDESTVQVLLEKYPKLFPAFLKERKKIELKKDKPLSKEEMEKLPQARLEFLERVEYAEYVKTLVTPELVEKIIDHEFETGAEMLPFKAIIGLSKPEVVAVVVQEQMLSMACMEPDRFDKLAGSLETLMAHKRTNRYQEAEKKAEETLHKYKLGDGNFDRLVEASRSGMPRAQYVKMLRDQVIESKGLFAGRQRKIDEKYEERKKEIDSLTPKLRELLIDIEDKEHEMSDQEDEVDRLGHLAWLERDHEEEHPVHDELAQAQEKLEEIAEEVVRMADARDKMRARIEALEEANEALKEQTSHQQAEDLKKQIRLIDVEMAKVQDYEKKIGETLKAALVESKLLREGVHAAFFKEHASIAETKHAPADASEARERIFKKALSTQETLQGDFDRYFFEARSQGSSDSREDLMDRFVENEEERIEADCRKKAEAEGGDGWLSRLVASIFVRKKRNAIRSDLKQKRQNLH